MPVLSYVGDASLLESRKKPGEIGCDIRVPINVVDDGYGKDWEDPERRRWHLNNPSPLRPIFEALSELERALGPEHRISFCGEVADPDHEVEIDGGHIITIGMRTAQDREQAIYLTSEASEQTIIKAMQSHQRRCWEEVIETLDLPIMPGP